MTANQIAFYNAKEGNRHNLVSETQKTRELQESERSNRAKEFETHRSNRAKEFETNRSNVANEQISRDKNLITGSYYSGQLANQSWYNQSYVAELMRHNQETENLGAYNAKLSKYELEQKQMSLESQIRKDDASAYAASQQGNYYAQQAGVTQQRADAETVKANAAALQATGNTVKNIGTTIGGLGGFVAGLGGN